MSEQALQAGDRIIFTWDDRVQFFRNSTCLKFSGLYVFRTNFREARSRAEQLAKRHNLRITHIRERRTVSTYTLGVDE